MESTENTEAEVRIKEEVIDTEIEERWSTEPIATEGLNLDIKEEFLDIKTELESPTVVASKIFNLNELKNEDEGEENQGKTSHDDNNCGKIGTVKEENQEQNSNGHRIQNPNDESSNDSIEYLVYVDKTFMSNVSKRNSEQHGEMEKQKLKMRPNSFMEDSPTKLLCLFCGNEFHSKLEWRKHMDDVHDFKSYDGLNMEKLDLNKMKCNYCHKILFTKCKGVLENHTMTHLPFRKYIVCIICNEQFSLQAHMNRHIFKKHSIEGYIQDKKSDQNYIEYNVKYLCAFCGKDKPTKWEWREHMYLKHAFGKPATLNMEFSLSAATCKQCKRTFTTSQMGLLQQHRITHLPYNRYIQCSLCGEVFARFLQFRRHTEKNCFKELPKDVFGLLSVTSVTKFELLCPFCGIEFSSNTDWRKHLNKCHDFNQFENLNVQILANGKAKCKDCRTEIYLRLRSAIESHRITHLPYNRYMKCKLCGELFSYHLRFKQHFNSKCV